MLLKDRMKYLRKELGLKQEDISNLLGCKVGKIKQIEAGKTATISYSDSKLIEKKYRVNEQWLRNGIGDFYAELSVDDFVELENEFSSNSATVNLPYYKDIKASAGYGCIIDDNCKKEYIKIPKMLLPNSYSVLEVVGVHGDSMEPTFYNDDLIVIDKDRKNIINGKIFIVFYENELYIKRVFVLPVGRIILKSDNSFYPDIEVSTDNFKIIGQVVTALNFKKLI